MLSSFCFIITIFYYRNTFYSFHNTKSINVMLHVDKKLAAFGCEMYGNQKKKKNLKSGNVKRK